MEDARDTQLNDESAPERELVSDGEADDYDLDEAGQKHLDAQVGAYKVRLPEIFAQSQQEWNDAQRTIALYWGKAFHRYEVCFHAAYEFSEGIKDRHRAEAESHQDRTFELLTRFQSWALLTTSEARSLIFTGHRGATLALSRRMFELAVISTFVVAQGGDIAERFIDHEDYWRLKWREEYDREATALGAEGTDPNELEALRERCDALATKYHQNYLSDYGWAAKALHPQRPDPKADFRQILEATHLKPLRHLYLRGSHLIHVGALGSVSHIDETPDGSAFVTGPSPFGLALPASIILNGLGACTKAFVTQAAKSDYRDFEYSIMQFKMLERLKDEAEAAFDAAEVRVTEASTQRTADTQTTEPEVD